MSVKEIAREAVESLSNDATWEELYFRLYTREMLEHGLCGTPDAEMPFTREEVDRWYEKKYERYVRQTVEMSIREAEEGGGFSHDEFRRKMKKWLE